jgi:hypothetical protein
MANCTLMSPTTPSARAIALVCVLSVRTWVSSSE